MRERWIEQRELEHHAPIIYSLAYHGAAFKKRPSDTLISLIPSPMREDDRAELGLDWSDEIIIGRKARIEIGRVINSGVDDPAKAIAAPHPE